MEHKFSLIQDHYFAFMNGYFDATNNCSKAINRAMKQYLTTGKNRIHPYQSDPRFQNRSWPKIENAYEEYTETIQEDYRNYGTIMHF